MRPSPLVLEGYYVKELSVELNPKFAAKHDYLAWIGFHFQPEDSFQPDPVTFDVDGEISSNKDDPSRYRYEIKIDSHRNPRKKFPYYFRVALVGYFRMDKEYPADRAKILLYANAPALLYSAAREVLAITTGRGPYPAIVLPSVNFLDDVEKMAVSMAKKIGPALKGKKARVNKAPKKRTSKKALK